MPIHVIYFVNVIFSLFLSLMFLCTERKTKNKNKKYYENYKKYLTLSHVNVGGTKPYSIYIQNAKIIYVFYGYAGKIIKSNNYKTETFNFDGKQTQR